MNRGGKYRVLAALTVMTVMMSAFAVIGAQGSLDIAAKPVAGIEDPVTIVKGQGSGGNEIVRKWVAPTDGYFHQWVENSGLKGITIYTYDITDKPRVTCSSSLITFSDAGAYPTGTVQLGYFEVLKNHEYKWIFSPDGRAGTSAQYFWTLEPKVSHPVAAFTYTFTASALTVDASTSYDLDGTIVQYVWHWGDGLISVGVEASHQYAMYDGHKVTLTVTDNDGLSSTTSQSTPPPYPYILYGYARDSSGALLTGCNIEVTDLWTGASLNEMTGMYGVEGYYQIDLCTIPGGWKIGDTFAVSATMGSISGSSQFVATYDYGPVVEVDLILTEGIPTADAGPGQYSWGEVYTQLDGSLSYSDVGIVSYLWTWTAGNEVQRSVSGMTPSFPSEWFFAYGNYTVTLTVIDASNKRATDTVWIDFGFRIGYDTPAGAQGMNTPSYGYYKLRIENQGMTSFDWTIIDCSLTSPPYEVLDTKVSFSSGDQVLVTDAFWMVGGHYYQSEYVPHGPAGSFMDIYAFFVPYG